MCEVEDKVEFTIDELEGAALDKALNKIGELNTDYSWWTDTKNEWVDTILPQDWAIFGVDEKKMWFDLGRDRSLELTDGYIRLRELMKLKPEWFTHLALKTLVELGWFTLVRIDCYRGDTRGVCSYGPNYDPVVEGTVFDGMSGEDFAALCEPALDELYAKLHEYVKEAAHAALLALDREYDHLWERDTCMEIARANEWLFDEEGNML